MGKELDPIAAAMAEMGVATAAAKELTDGAIRCSVPGCGGIVKADYVVPTKVPVGLCPQKEVHDLLREAAKTPTTDPVGTQIRDLIRLTRMARAGWKPKA